MLPMKMWRGFLKQITSSCCSLQINEGITVWSNSVLRKEINKKPAEQAEGQGEKEIKRKQMTGACSGTWMLPLTCCLRLHFTLPVHLVHRSLSRQERQGWRFPLPHSKLHQFHDFYGQKQIGFSFQTWLPGVKWIHLTWWNRAKIHLWFAYCSCESTPCKHAPWKSLKRDFPRSNRSFASSNVSTPKPVCWQQPLSSCNSHQFSFFFRPTSFAFSYFLQDPGLSISSKFFEYGVLCRKLLSGRFSNKNV